MRNEYGEDGASNQLTVLDSDYELRNSLNSELLEPDYLELPSSIYLVKATSNELTIRWNAAKLRPTPLDVRLQITGYQVSYFSAIFADQKETIERNRPITWKSILTQSTNLTIDDLEPNSGYVFVIRCQTKYGLSVPSNLSEEFYTTSSTALIQPSLGKSTFDVEKLLAKVFKLRKQLTYIQIQLLRAKPVNASTIRLIWQTNPSNALSTINGYLVYYREHSNHLQDYESEDFNLDSPSDHRAKHHIIDHNTNLHSTFHTHHHNHHHSAKLDERYASFKLVVLNDSSLDSAMIHNLHPFTTYQFFIIAYHSPYLLSMPSEYIDQKNNYLTIYNSHI